MCSTTRRSDFSGAAEKPKRGFPFPDQNPCNDLSLMATENLTAVWIRKKLRANAPFLLDELTPSGVKLFVALGWPDDEKSNGYRDAKKKVADRVPAQDWSFVQDGPETYPQKSEGKWGGHLKRVVAISANGMKHLLAHVPHQELANAWLQYLIDAEQKLRLKGEAMDRDSLKEEHKKTGSQLVDQHGVKKGAAMQAISTNALLSESFDAVKARVKEEKGLRAQPQNVKPWDHATPKTMAHKAVLAANLRMVSQYADRNSTSKSVASTAVEVTLDSIATVSNGRDIKFVPRADGKGFRRCVDFEIRDGQALPPDRARREIAKDRDRQHEENQLELPGS